ncbi:hypothetical protein B0H13DRAFT_2361227 [Mycena leptocephala]|nr:hypothetical protein B0H13DRAFT_2361227 [Mycena leptocephala]
MQPPPLRSKFRKGPTDHELETQRAPPPLRSKFRLSPTNYEIETQHVLERREKARRRMAEYVSSHRLPPALTRPRKRAELKSRPHEEQAAAAARAREHQATYRERNRNTLRKTAAHRRLKLYWDKFGPAAYEAYEKKCRDAKRRAIQRKRDRRNEDRATLIEES